jgi:hypothetical protein
LASKIEQAVEKIIDKQVLVMVRERSSINEVLEHNPFEGEYETHKQMHVLFLKETVPPDKQKEILSLATDHERIAIRGREIYALLLGGMAESLLGRGLLEKKLKMPMTARNWRTVEKLAGAIAMKIVNATPHDVDVIFDLYDKAIEFQKTVFDKTWLGFDRELVDTEIAEGRLWKIVEDDRVACIFSVAYADPIIWGEHSHESAMYIHRIVTNPEFRGRGYVRAITDLGRSIMLARNGLRFVGWTRGATIRN